MKDAVPSLIRPESSTLTKAVSMSNNTSKAGLVAAASVVDVHRDLLVAVIAAVGELNLYVRLENGALNLCSAPGANDNNLDMMRYVVSTLMQALVDEKYALRWFCVTTTSYDVVVQGCSGDGRPYGPWSTERPTTGTAEFTGVL